MESASRVGQRTPTVLLGLVALLVLASCGTLTGIPAHGGGKRFATEQRLVSASIRAALKDIDVTALRGKRAALVFDLVADEGGGTLSGGRWTPGLLFSAGSVLSPVTTTSNAFQVFNLAESGGNYSNSGSSGGTTTVSTTLQSGSNTSSGSSTQQGSSSSNGSSTSDGSTSSSGTNTSSGSNTNTSNTTNTGTSSGGSTSTTGGTTTNSNFNQTDSSTNATTGSGTSTSSGTNTQNTTNTGSGTTTQDTTSSGSGTNNNTGSNSGTSTTTSTSSNNGGSTTRGGFNSQRQTVSPTPSETTSVTEGTRREHTATLQYKGLGDYQNFNVPKSDASLLMGLVRNYLLFSGVIPTTPTDPSAEVLVYITVDIFGTVRSRFDALVYNNETVKAETSFEISAFDREGKLIMRPQVANRESRYREHYLMWAGPVTTNERVDQGQGLLVDFTDVDGSKASYNAAAPVERTHLLGKN